MRGHKRCDLLLGDYCDGTDFQQHPLFSSSHHSIQINLYFDDAEVCNPLGSKAKVHKIGKYACFSCELTAIEMTAHIIAWQKVRPGMVIFWKLKLLKVPF